MEDGRWIPEPFVIPSGMTCSNMNLIEIERFLFESASKNHILGFVFSGTYVWELDVYQVCFIFSILATFIEL